MKIFLFILIICLASCELPPKRENTILEAFPPSPPRDIKVEHISFFSADIFWSIPKKFGREIDGKDALLKIYEIEYSPDLDFLESKTVTSLTQAVHLRNLKTNTRYNVRVRAVNESGITSKNKSPNTSENIISFTTNKILPITPPRKITAIPGDLYIDLNWIPPYSKGISEKGNTESAIKAYVIYYFPQKNTNQKLEIVKSPKSTSHRVSNLAVETIYVIQIFSKNQRNKISNYEERIVRTTVASLEKPNPPSNLTISEQGKKAIVSWSAPLYTGKTNSQTPSNITGYKLYYSEDSDFQTEIQELTFSEKEKTTTINLKGNTFYYFRITAVNDALTEGLSSIPIEKKYKTGNHATPPAFPLFKEDKISQKEGVLTLTWTQPSNPGDSAEGIFFGSTIVSYIVEYTRGDLNPNFENVEGSKEHVPISFQDRTISFSEELKSGITYLFRIYAVNNAGKSSPKSPVIKVVLE